MSTSEDRGTPPRRRLSADARRELIEQAATELFAERGYRGAAMEEIARRSGVSVPVVYDHFPSKQALHRRLLERHFAELRAVWGAHAADADPAERLPRALDAWFAYVESHPYAWRMLFRDTTGDPEIEAMHREVAAQSRAALLPLLALEPGAYAYALVSPTSDATLEMVWELLRGALQSLALWWYEHRDVPREQVVAAAMSVLWLGLDRAAAGETWPPSAARDPGC